jgi:ribosomal protein RSM22 (predicted rRNA methylase)
VAKEEQMAKQSHTKIAHRLWARSTDQWVKDQGSDPVEMCWIMSDGKVLEGFVNLKTGKRIWSAMRRATAADRAKDAARKLAKKAKQAMNSFVWPGE